MREVNPEQQSNDFDFKKILNYLVEFVQHPVKKISQIPNWGWSSILFVQIAISVTSGVLAGLIKLNFYRVASGVFLMPVVSTISSLLLATFFYYYFQFFEDRIENFRKLFSFVILTSIPFYLFQIVSEYFAPISLIGFGFTSLLAVVGLVENFSVNRKRAYQLIGILFALVLATWVMNYFTLSSS